VSDRKTLVVRISKELWEELRGLAAQELRSVNAQIEYLLREGLARRGRGVAGRARGSDGKRRNA
jgi:hypothetical protein